MKTAEAQKILNKYRLKSAVDSRVKWDDAIQAMIEYASQLPVPDNRDATLRDELIDFYDFIDIGNDTNEVHEMNKYDAVDEYLNSRKSATMHDLLNDDSAREERK